MFSNFSAMFSDFSTMFNDVSAMFSDFTAMFSVFSAMFSDFFSNVYQLLAIFSYFEKKSGNWRTDGLTALPSYRDARAHLYTTMFDIFCTKISRSKSLPLTLIWRIIQFSPQNLWNWFILSFALISKQCELPVKAAFADRKKKLLLSLGRPLLLWST